VRGDVHPLILNCFTSVKGVVSLASVWFHHLGENPRYPLNVRLGDFQSRSGPFEERKGFSSRREVNNVFCVVRPLAYPYTN